MGGKVLLGFHSLPDKKEATLKQLKICSTIDAKECQMAVITKIMIVILSTSTRKKKRIYHIQGFLCK